MSPYVNPYAIYAGTWLGFGGDSPTARNIEAARDAGLLLHHEVHWDDGGLVRDDWYAAHPDWVGDYHRSGGIWGYAD